jgi:flagellar protein FlaG
MSKNMEVIDVYVDSYAGIMATSRKSTSTQGATGSARGETAKTNTVRTDSMDGGGQTVQTKVDTGISEEDIAAENEKIKKALENMKAQLPHSEVKFGIHEKTDRVTIKLVDKETKEVIKEFPPEKTLDMIAKCMEIAGVLVDEKL